LSVQPLARLDAREPRVTTIGLCVRGTLTFEAWAAIGQRIARITSGSAWSLGDWLIYGEKTYGERYRTALEATDFDYKTLRNLAWVARAFEPSRRRSALSFSHHAEVASLSQPEQELWLTRAETSGWSRNELRRRLLARHGRRQKPLPRSVLHMPVDEERERRWREEATLRQQALDEWMAVALDAAADAILAAGPEPVPEVRLAPDSTYTH
jgi:hypothetical protein